MSIKIKGTFRSVHEVVMCWCISLFHSKENKNIYIYIYVWKRMVQDVNSTSCDTSALATVLLAIKALSLLKNIPVGHDACSE